MSRVVEMMSDQEVEANLDKMFKELVPASGPAETVAGEIVRAINRVEYRRWNDGDHIGIGYGKETCNPAARYLKQTCDRFVAQLIDEMWGVEDDDTYDEKMKVLMRAVLDYLTDNTELTMVDSTVDMWDLRDPEEDVDDEDNPNWGDGLDEDDN